MEGYNCNLKERKNLIIKYLILQTSKCGDIIQVLCDEALPCDILLLNTKSDDRKCYITTANLDGETNFKVKIE